MLVYKNAIANGLRTTQKLFLKNVKQFDDLIKYNDNPMNNNFWYLFTQFISQLIKMHKKANIIITEWEHHFQILQHGFFFDENNPDVIESSENENWNEKFPQNDASPSQNILYLEYKTHSLDECAKTKVKKLRVIPKHLDNHKSKQNADFFSHETYNTKNKTRL